MTSSPTAVDTPTDETTATQDARPSSATPPAAAPAAVSRDVGCHLVFDVTSTADLAFAIAAARVPGWRVADRLQVSLDGEPLAGEAGPVELVNAVGERVHLISQAPTGRLVVDYSARVEPVTSGQEAPALPRPPAELELERLEALRPSRYCPSDELAAFAGSQFGRQGDHSPAELVEAVGRYVSDRLVYTSGSSVAFDGAVQTLLRGQGVCRDYAHLVVALCRALELPARLAAVYAPGLAPMDFHAVAEVRVDGTWQVVDATGLSSRPALVRISTGRDAADTAFLTSLGGGVTLVEMAITATTDGDLPVDDGGPVILA